MALLQPSDRLAVCLASGPSLKAADVQAIKDRAFVIAINSTVALAPWADVLICGDPPWTRRNNGCPGFLGRKVSLSPDVPKEFPDIEYIQATGVDGMEWEKGKARSGGNSGYVAIQLAAQAGACKILLLGYDMQPSSSGDHHWHEPHVNNAHPNYRHCLPRFQTLVEPLRERGIEVINCNPASALTAFPRQSLTSALG